MVRQSQLPRTGQTAQGEGRGRTSEPPHEKPGKEERTKVEEKHRGGQRGIERFVSPASEKKLRRHSAESPQTAQRFPLSLSRSECQSHA